MARLRPAALIVCPRTTGVGPSDNGTGRSRAAHYFDIFEQLTGTASKCQVTVRAEVGVGGYNDMAMFGKYPS